MNTIKSIGSALPSLPSFSYGSSTPSADTAIPPPLEPPQLSLLTTHREALQNFKTTLLHHIHYLEKRKVNPCGLGLKVGAEARRADTSVAWIGEELRDFGERLEKEEHEQDGSKELAATYTETGATHLSIAKLNEEYLARLNGNALTTLEHRLDAYKQFFTLHSAAVKAQASLDTLGQKIEKSKEAKALEDLQEEYEKLERDYQDRIDEIGRGAKSLMDGFGEEKDWIKRFVDEEIEHYSSCLSALTTLRSSISSSTARPRFPSPSTAPTLPSRSTSLKPPSTRMSRSKSDVPPPTFSSPEKDRTSFLRKAVGNRGSAGDLTTSGKDDSDGKRSRSGSVKEDGKRSRSGSLSVKDIEDGKRSRSGSGAGSMLSRVPGFGLRKKSHSVGEKEKNKDEGEETDTNREDDDDDDQYVTTPSTSNGGFGLSLPSLASVKKFGGNDTSKYSTLTDDILVPREPTPTIPPILKRTQTAPPRTPTTPTKPASPVNRTYIASWPYPPPDQDPDEEELTFEKNDLIKISSIVNEEWWVGQVVKGNNEGMVGLFPKGFVKEWNEGQASERKKPPPPPARKRGMSPSPVTQPPPVKDEADPFSDI